MRYHRPMRPILEDSQIHPSIRNRVGALHGDVVSDVQNAIANHRVVVVGMAQNPFPRKARRLLERKGIAHHYIEYGSYLSQWRRRNALKMWTGWPTLPMIFVDGVLIGGASDLQRLADNGELSRMLAIAHAAA